jgi:hypothetical protein
MEVDEFLESGLFPCSGSVSGSRSMEVMEVDDLVLVPLRPGLRWENASVG